MNVNTQSISLQHYCKYFNCVQLKLVYGALAEAAVRYGHIAVMEASMHLQTQCINAAASEGICVECDVLLSDYLKERSPAGSSSMYEIKTAQMVGLCSSQSKRVQDRLSRPS